jgi:hypothetical protein
MINTLRHKGIFNHTLFQYPVHIIGCGGMGSRIAEGLVRMGVGIKKQSPIHLYDGDVFEEHNLANQWAVVRGLKLPKVEAVKDEMQEINEAVAVFTNPYMIEGAVTLTGVVFLCLDSMEARRVVVDEVLAKNPFVPCVIETRMDAGVGVSHCFDPSNDRQLACWRMYWHSDYEADNLQGCSGDQSIISAVYGTTALALKQFEQFARIGSTHNMPNRVYQDFDEVHTSSEVWPTHPLDYVVLHA